MGVSISFGGIPVPKGWKLWSPTARPDPGRMFFEIRYHHTGVWKLTLDFRPVHGAFPELWMPPLMWRYALELEVVGELLENTSVQHWAPKLLGIHPTNVMLFEQAIMTYGQKWKNKKKMLYGTAEGAGLHEHSVNAGYMLEHADWNDPIGAEQVIMSLVGGAAKKLSVSGHSGKPKLPQKSWQVKGHDFPYDPVLMDTLTSGETNVLVRVELTGAYQNPQEKTWEFNFVMYYAKEPGDLTYAITMALKDHTPHQTLPLVECLGVRIMEMNQKRIRLRYVIAVDETIPMVLAYEYTPDLHPNLFPPHGHIGKSPSGYWVPNPKLKEASQEG